MIKCIGKKIHDYSPQIEQKKRHSQKDYHSSRKKNVIVGNFVNLRREREIYKVTVEKESQYKKKINNHKANLISTQKDTES